MKPRNVYPEDTAKLYNDYVSTGLRYRAVAEALLAAAGPLVGLDALDLGCGTGLVTRMLAEQVGDKGSVIGIDGSSSMLEQAKHAPSVLNIRYICSPAELVDRVLKTRVDIVFSSAAFWQFQREPTLKALTKVIKSDGHLCFNLSAGFFNFKDSGMWQGSDKREYTQSDILVQWVSLAHKLFPGREFPPKTDKTQNELPQTLDQLTVQLAKFGFVIEKVEPLRIEIPKNDEYKWLQIPQWTDKMLAPLTYQERITILSDIFRQIPDQTMFLGRWVTIVAKYRGVR